MVMGLMKIINQEVRRGQEKTEARVERVRRVRGVLRVLHFILTLQTRSTRSTLSTLNSDGRAGMVRAEPGGVAFGQRIDQFVIEVVKLRGDA